MICTAWRGWTATIKAAKCCYYPRELRASVYLIACSRRFFCTCVDTPTPRHQREQGRYVYYIHTTPQGLFIFRRPNYTLLAQEAVSRARHHAAPVRRSMLPRSAPITLYSAQGADPGRPTASHVGRNWLAGPPRAMRSPSLPSGEELGIRHLRRGQPARSRRQGSTVSAASEASSAVQELSRRGRATRWPSIGSIHPLDPQSPGAADTLVPPATSPDDQLLLDASPSPENHPTETLSQRLRRRRSNFSNRTQSAAQRLKRRGSASSLRPGKVARSLRSRRSTFSIRSSGRRYTLSTARAAAVGKVRRSGDWVRGRFGARGGAGGALRMSGGQVRSGGGGGDEEEEFEQEAEGLRRRFSRRFDELMRPSSSSAGTSLGLSPMYPVGWGMQL